VITISFSTGKSLADQEPIIRKSSIQNRVSAKKLVCIQLKLERFSNITSYQVQYDFNVKFS